MPVPEEVRQLADLLERRWQLSIIYAALTGALRFHEFADAIAGISPRMLSERLRDLETAGLVIRAVIPSSPPTVEYRLTERGRKLAPIIEAMRSYADQPAGARQESEAEQHPGRSRGRHQLDDVRQPDSEAPPGVAGVLGDQQHAPA
jgi:DNA-binding HxlR family transcriptional regulator